MNTIVDEAPTQTPSYGGYSVYAPTLSQRAWRALGFRYHLGEAPKDTDNMEGWMCTETRMQFSFLDRLRLLLTGRLYIRLIQHLPVKCDYARNRLDWQIEPFGGAR